MPVVAVVGAQWGDEGKGKIIDLLAEKANVVVRYSGGDNAGHTVVNPLGHFALHLVPSGIFRPETICIIGNGVVVNPEVLLQEIDNLKKAGLSVANLFLSDRAHLIMPYHILLDGLEEDSRGGKALGTTRKGVGPAFVDKTARLGIRVGDLLDREAFHSRLSAVLDLKNRLLTRVYSAQPLSFLEVYDKYCQYGQRLAPFVRETDLIVEEALGKGQTVLLEGAQGTLLDPDFGTYPYVTSSSPMAGGACLGLGLSPAKFGRIIGVFKAYTTRVGGGPMPTELHDDTAQLIRERAHEYGTTTGRPRRCGWFDAVATAFSAHINGMTDGALTRLDILEVLPSIKVCTAYRVDDTIYKRPPSSLALLERCQPVYEELSGWQTPISDIRRFKDLPRQAQAYVKRLEELVCPISIVSVGPGREQTIMVREVI